MYVMSLVQGLQIGVSETASKGRLLTCKHGRPQGDIDGELTNLSADTMKC